MEKNLLNLVNKVKKRNGELVFSIEDIEFKIVLPVEFYEDILVLSTALSKQESDNPLEQDDFGIDINKYQEGILKTSIKYIAESIAKENNISFDDAKLLVINYSNSIVPEVYKALGLISEESYNDIKKKSQVMMTLNENLEKELISRKII